MYFINIRTLLGFVLFYLLARLSFVFELDAFLLLILLLLQLCLFLFLFQLLFSLSITFFLFFLNSLLFLKIFLSPFFFFLPLLLNLFFLFDCQCIEVFIFMSFYQLIGYFDDFIDFNMLFDVLKILQDNCELVLDDIVFAVDYNGDCKKFDILHAIVGREDTLPNTKSIEEGKILSI